MKPMVLALESLIAVGSILACAQSTASAGATVTVQLGRKVRSVTCGATYHYFPTLTNPLISGQRIDRRGSTLSRALIRHQVVVKDATPQSGGHEEGASDRTLVLRFRQPLAYTVSCGSITLSQIRGERFPQDFREGSMGRTLP